MENDIFLKQLQNSYESLKYFSILDNSLILHLDKEYKIYLNHINLKDLNPNLFLLKPQEILHILYMLELLYQTNLKESEISFIESYTNKYLSLNDQALEQNEADNNLVWCFSIPIYTSYDPTFINSEASTLIRKIINNHSIEIENSKGNHPKLVLTNPQFEIIKEEDNIGSIEKAGFAAIFLIAGAITATCLYIIYFIVGH